MPAFRIRTLLLRLAWTAGLFGLWLTGCTPAGPAPSASQAQPPTATRRPVTATAARPSPTATATERPGIGVPAEQVRGTIVEIWHPWAGEQEQALRALVEDFNLENEWQIVVKPAAQPGLDGLAAQVEAARQAELPLPAAAVLFLQQGLPWEAAGLLADWQPYLDDPAWGIQATEQAEFYHAFWDAGVVEGRRLGIPALRSAQFLYYNRTWAGELGFKTPPADPQGFADQACAAAAALRRDDSTENDAFGGWVANANDAAALGWIYAFGGQVYDGKQYSFNMPQVEQALTFQRELYDGACAWFDESGSAAQAFAQRQALFASGSLMGIPEQAEALRQAGRGDEWTVIAFPSPEAAPAITGYGPDFLLFQSSPEQQLAAWLFVRWLSQPAQHARLVEAGGSFPLQAAELEPLTGYRARYPAYEAALGLIPAARSEPAAASWETVRWVLGDAATQLFRPYFSAEQIPNMLAYLERTVQDILAGPQDAGVWSTSTPTLGPSPTP